MRSPVRKLPPIRNACFKGYVQTGQRRQLFGRLWKASPELLLFGGEERDRTVDLLLAKYT